MHPTLSAAEFAAVMDRAGWSAAMELIDGEVVVIPPSGGEAALAQTEVVHELRRWQAGGGGRVLAEAFVRVGDGFLAPDVAWWPADRLPDIGPGALDVVPALVVEVLSPATRANDLGPKRQAYLAAGVGELWLVDPAGRSVTVVTPDGERVLTAGDDLRSSLLTGFALPVRRLFR